MISALLALVAVTAGAGNNVPELRDAVVYEANLRALGPQVGFDTLRGRLPAIRALGTNVLWLMPIQPVGKVRSAGGLGSPYAPSDLDAINPEFGDAAGFKRLVSAAHKLKMAVIIDWVADHTSWDCAWIKGHPDWYLHNAKGEISIPPGTGWNDVAALDHKNLSMRAAMIDSMEGWITRFGLDGFRCDSSDRMPVDFWKSAISTLRASTPNKLFMLAEGFKAEDYAEGFDLTYGWDFCSKLREVFGGKPATQLAESAAFEARDIPAGARRLRFVTNHDMSAWDGSLIEFYKTREGIKTAFAITALYGGTPLIYTGQEVGWDQRIPIFTESSIDWTKNQEAGKWIGRLMDLRRGHPALLDGTLVDQSSADVVFFTRRKGSDEAILIANMRNLSIVFTIPTQLRGSWRNGESDGEVKLETTVALPPYGRVIAVRHSP